MVKNSCTASLYKNDFQDSVKTFNQNLYLKFEERNIITVVYFQKNKICSAQTSFLVKYRLVKYRHVKYRLVKLVQHAASPRMINVLFAPVLHIV